MAAVVEAGGALTTATTAAISIIGTTSGDVIRGKGA
jgi:hypothetical protein